MAPEDGGRPAGTRAPAGAHRHDSAGEGLGRALGISLLVAAADLLGGILGGSMTLLSDSGHQLTDVLSAAVAWGAARRGENRPTRMRSYGFHRAGILAAALNALVLFAVAGFIVWGAVSRLAHPSPISPDVMGATAVFGLLANGWVVTGLWRHAKDLNRRAMLIHALSDGAGSLAALVGAAVIAITGWTPLDPILSLMIAGLVAWSAVGVLSSAVNVLMEGVPPHLVPEEIRQALLSEEGVSGLHDLHVWSLGGGRTILTCHLLVEDIGVAESQALVERAARHLNDAFGIAHATIQTETRPFCSLGEGCDEHIPAAAGDGLSRSRS